MARLSAFLVWALAAASAVFWGLRVFSQPLAMPAHAQPVTASTGSPALVARMFAAAPEAPAAAGAPAAEAAASSRFRLLGVMAPPRGRRGGVALISVDGQPPRAYRSGAAVTEGFVLQQLGPRSATLGPTGGAGGFTLELPALPAPNTGRLPSAASGTAGSRAGPPPEGGQSSRPQPQPAEAPPPAPPVEEPDEEPSHRRPPS